MSKAVKTASSLGAVALVLSGAAMAAAPISFDQWTVTGGAVSIGDLDTVTAGTQDCPAGWTCGTAITGDGFYQRQVTDGGGIDYFQTIITDKGVTGTGGAGNLNFSDESFVRTGNVSGLANKSAVGEVTTSGTVTTTFGGSTELLIGWANSGGGATSADDQVKLNQSIDMVDTAGENFRTDFWLDQVGQNGATAKLMRLTSNVEIDSTAGSAQDFVLVDRKGTPDVNAGTVSLGGTTGGTIDWAAGTNVKAIWVGQDMSGIADVAQVFGYTSFENVDGTSTTGTDFISEFSLTSGAAINWDTTAAPTGWGSLATDGTGGPF
jgi:hypothetical protein